MLHRHLWINKRNFLLYFYLDEEPSYALCVVAQSLSRVQLTGTLWTAAHQPSLSFTVSWSLLKLMSIESMMPSNHLILSSPSPPAFKLSQHQGLFQWVGFSHQVAKHWNFSFSPSNECLGWFSLGLTRLISLQPKGLSIVFSSTTVWKYQFFCAQPFLWPNSHIHAWLLEKP